METLQKALIEQLEDFLRENPDRATEFDIEKVIAETTPELVKSIKASLSKIDKQNA